MGRERRPPRRRRVKRHGSPDWWLVGGREADGCIRAEKRANEEGGEKKWTAQSGLCLHGSFFQQQKLRQHIEATAHPVAAVVPALMNANTEWANPGDVLRM